MNLKKLFTRTHVGLIILLLTLSILSLLTFQNRGNIKRTNEIRLNSYGIASHLRKTSIDLTRYCRTYVLTGDSTWEDKYLKKLDVHYGNKPRPNGRIISFQDSLKKFDFTKEEFFLLEKASQNFNNLIAIEKVAMNATKGLFNDGSGNFTGKGTPDIAKAHSVLFDDRYYENKALIMNSIEEFYQVFKPRIQKSVQMYDTYNYWLIGIINALIFSIISISTISFFVIKNKIILQLDELKKTKIIADEKAKENRKLSVAVEQSANSIVLTDIKGNIEYTNPKFSKLTGYTASEILGKNQRILKSGTQPKAYYTKMWQTIKSGKTWKGEFHNKDIRGNLFWEQVTITAIKDDEGKIINYLGIKEDVTNRKRGEEELLKAKEKAEESNRLKTEFLNNMSHEIRTPMNGILGFSKMLLDSDVSEEKRTNFVNIIQNSGNQLLQIIDDILEISRLETNQVKVKEEEVCLNDTLLELFSIFDIKAKENKTPLYLKKSLSDKQSTIFTDKKKLNKVLSNLLENAIKFTDRGSIEFGYFLKNNRVELYIKDTGAGIDLEDQMLIFDRFSQTEKDLSKKAGGLGLGLSIAKENIELLGGEISVVSEKEKGATFFVSIPYNPIFKDDENDDSKYEYTILIAEDEEVNYLFLEIILIEEMKLNCNILHAKDGEEAVEICKNNPEIDIVFMDIKMPKMNGFDATEQIKKTLPKLPIVALTAYSTSEDKEKAIHVGFMDFISKPINNEALKSKIKLYLRQLKEIKSLKTL
ncbi:MAG: hypothetical protein COB01_04560 [Lutibacter sp.]|nr:MAG: hypothetical protein COB01_04560 [Lutibacter sp.]